MLAELLGASAVAVLAALSVPVVIVVLLYNGLIGKRNRASNAQATVDVMLKKRYDLVPNLVAVVEGYAEHERGVLTLVTELRAKALSGGLSNAEKADLNNQLTAALKTVFAVAEGYPDLKANKGFLHLQAALTELEEQISAARRAFNAAVLEYNNAVEMLPSSIVASALGWRRNAFFEASDAERVKPGVASGLGVGK